MAVLGDICRNCRLFWGLGNPTRCGGGTDGLLEGSSSKIAVFFKPIFCENFEIAAVQKDANLVELEKCCRTHILLQNFVLIQPRTSPPKICKICKKIANFPNFADPSPLYPVAT